MSEHDPATEMPADESAEADEPTGPEPELLHGCIVAESLGQTVVHPTREQFLDLMKALADDGYAMIVDLCGVDYLDHMSRPLPDGVERERFEVVVNMLDITHRRRIRVRVQVPEAEPTVASLCDLHPGAEAYEREAYDMFGIVFDDHPDLTRILMPEDWIGHPLRKDYDAGRIPVQFKGAHA
jgi:NADH-quinone oxidoreductase subunit C